MLLLVTLQPDRQWAAQTADTAQVSDRHVPLIFLGRSFRRGTYETRVHAVDVAPTLAEVLGLTPAEPIDGRPLVEALEER